MQPPPLAVTVVQIGIDQGQCLTRCNALGLCRRHRHGAAPPPPAGRYRQLELIRVAITTVKIQVMVGLMRPEHTILCCVGLSEFMRAGLCASCLSDCVLETAIGPAVALFFLLLGCVGILSCAAKSYRNTGPGAVLDNSKLPDWNQINTSEPSGSEIVPENSKTQVLNEINTNTSLTDTAEIRTSDNALNAADIRHENIHPPEIHNHGSFDPHQISAQNLQDNGSEDLLPQKLEFPEIKHNAGTTFLHDPGRLRPYATRVKS